MKETKIAKEHLKKDTKSFWGWVCLEHKQTCQRWLEYLGELERYKFKCGFMSDYDLCDMFENVSLIINQIEDLKQAIKLYDNAGI